MKNHQKLVILIKTYMFVSSIWILIPNSLAINWNLRRVFVDDVIVEFIKTLGAEAAVDALEGSDAVTALEMPANLQVRRFLPALDALSVLNRLVAMSEQMLLKGLHDEENSATEDADHGRHIFGSQLSHLFQVSSRVSRLYQVALEDDAWLELVEQRLVRRD